MKRILSLILVVSMFLSVTAFGAITTTEIYTDTETGYTYIFGKFEDSDTNVGFEINGKEYDLRKEDINNPEKTAFEVAKEKGNIFGIGFLDATQKGAEEKKFTATPFTYNAENAKNTQEAITVDLPEYDNLKLKDIKVNGETVAAFSPYKSYYYYETNDVSSITKEDIEATAQAAYANVTVSDAGNNNYVITTTAPDSEEVKTVEIRVREKGEPQNPEEQIAPFKGSKTVRIYKDLSEKFSPLTGDSGIYDWNEVRIKASAGNEIPSNSTEYSVVLIQFDISKITNINDRVLLDIPVNNANTASNPDRIAEIGFMAVDTELPISYHPSTSPYFSGTKTTDEYQKFNDEIVNGEVASTTNSDLTPEMINKEIANAFEMLDYKNIENDVAGRVVVANSAKETKTVDVTDYIKAKLEKGDETATFMVRAIFNPEINSTGSEVCIRPYSANAALSFTKFEGEIAASDIKVNGETIKDFNKDTLNYSVIVNKDADIPQVTATVADTENLTIKVTQATEVPGAATVKVTSYDGQSKTYTINFDNPFEKGVFIFDSAASKRVEFDWGAAYNKISNVKDLGNSNWVRTYGNSSGYVVPRDALLITFNSTTQGLNEDDRIYLNLYVKGFDPYATTLNGVPGGKVKVIYTQSSIDVNSQVDKTNYTVSSNYITSEITEFKIDVTNLVKNALLNTNAVDGIKTIQLLIETDEADAKKTTTGKYIYSDDTVSYEHTNLGGILQLDTYSPTITYAE
ncbi:MAG: hypothetical protein E7419_08125 [Ruminococcaceae bacterium]|nr:hypothetical protein [Oscillospiraceae bacterium]